MQRKILYLINPIAGTEKKENLEVLLSVKTTARNIHYKIVRTPDDGAYGHIEAEARSGQYTDVCICGGDGTVNEVVQALAHLPVCFSIIPYGSGNGLAYSAGIPKNALKALQLVFDGKPTQTDAFMINGSFACMLAGLGLDARVAADFAKQKSRGLLTYARLTIKAFLNAKSYRFEVTEKDRSWEVDAMLMTISNSNQFGNQFTIAPRASLNDGLLDVVAIKKMPKWLFLLSAAKQLMRGEVQEIGSTDKRRVIYFQTSRLRIINKDLAPFHIDGDPRPTPTELKIEILPKYFKLIHG